MALQPQSVPSIYVTPIQSSGSASTHLKRSGSAMTFRCSYSSSSKHLIQVSMSSVDGVTNLASVLRASADLFGRREELTWSVLVSNEGGGRRKRVVTCRVTDPHTGRVAGVLRSIVRVQGGSIILFFSFQHSVLVVGTVVRARLKSPLLNHFFSALSSLFPLLCYDPLHQSRSICNVRDNSLKILPSISI